MEGTSAPSANYRVKYSVNGGSYAHILNILSTGSIAFGDATLSASPVLLPTAGSLNISLGGKGLAFLSKFQSDSGTINGIILSNSQSVTKTSGIFNNVEIPVTFAPTSGTSTFTDLLIDPTINQTGGANGITRGLYVNPTLTAVADWRSIETSNNTGYAFYGAGTAASALFGNLSIGTATADRLLHVEASDAVTNAVTYAQRLSHITSGTAATSFGTGIEYELENASGTNVIAGTEEFVWNNASSGTERTNYTLKLMNTGTLATALTVTYQGGLTTTNSITSGSDLIAAAGSYVGWNLRSKMFSSNDGLIQLANNAATDFSRLQFGGTTSSFPALKRSSATIAVRLADDSADASISMATATLSGNLIGPIQALSGAGAVNVTQLTTAFTSSGVLDALTLADGTAGQIKTIVHVVDGGSGILTPTTPLGYATITFNAAGDSVTLQFFTQGWAIIGSKGVTIA